MTLSKNKIKELKSIAQTIQPKVLVGKNGLNNGALQSIDEVLQADELVKIKFLNNSIALDDQICVELAKNMNAELVQKIGKNIILYRKNEEK